MQSLTAEPLSGFEFASPETREMQLDDFANPGMATVDYGLQLFARDGANGKSCADCHGQEGSELDTGRIARYPIYSKQRQRVITLQGQVNICWEEQLDNAPAIYDSKQSVALETLVRYLARGETVNVDISGPMKKYYEAGRELYNMRFGQLDMACVQCHDYFPGQYLRGQRLSQGHSNGFPEYRLGSGHITSFQRRVAECFISFRAQPFDFGSEDIINLEVYVHARGNGLKIETPAVRY
jgi:sulfur-oxidizing protein SoxA